MKVAIVGSRTILKYDIGHAIEQSGFSPTEIVSGGADGIDTLAADYARKHNIPLSIFRPDWKRLGLVAGLERNTSIANYSEAGIIIHDGHSRGSLDTMNKLQRIGKPIFYLKVPLERRESSL